MFTGTAEVGSTVKIYRDGTLIGTSAVVPASGIYSYTTATNLPNGTFTITATATDPSLNLSPVSGGTTITIDNIVPSVTLNQASQPGRPHDPPRRSTSRSSSVKRSTASWAPA